MALSKSDHDRIVEILSREPTPTELAIFDAMWSEHCSYKSSRPILKTLPTDGPNVLLGVGEDAGIVEFATHEGHTYGIAVSHESHNHPSQVLPVEGAATGVGGVVRDVYCMGADVIGVLDSLHFGDVPNDPHATPNRIADGVVAGVAGYSNPLGVPNLGGETIYHESYTDNCLVNVAAIGLVRSDRIIRSRSPQLLPSIPHVVVLVGKATDTTGFGGASFSSDILDADQQVQNMGAVQVHDPFIKRVLVVALNDMFDYVAKHNIDIGFKDLGAGGLACAASELAAASQLGCDLDLEQVHTGGIQLPPEIRACAETQERFCLVVPANHLAAICDIFNKKHRLQDVYPGAGAYLVGRVTDTGAFRMRYRGEQVCDIPMDAITATVSVERHATPRDITRQRDTLPSADYTVQAVAQHMITRSNNAQKKYVYRNYDQFVKNNSVVIPGEADACVLAPIKGAPNGVAVTIDSNTYGVVDPYTAGAYAVAESVRNIIAVGAEPIALTDCLNYGNPEKGDVFFDFTEGVRGIADAARQLSPHKQVIPVISGNVSFYNESSTGQAIVPSPVVCCVGRMPDAYAAHRMQMIHPGSVIVVVGERLPHFSQTEFEKTLVDLKVPTAFTTTPHVHFEAEAAQNAAMWSMLNHNTHSEGIHAVHDISQGGLWQALVEMILGDRNWPLVGAAIQCPDDLDPATFLFSESGGYVCDVQPQHVSAVEAILTHHNVAYYVVGTTTPDTGIAITWQKKSILHMGHADMIAKWNQKNTEKDGTPIYNETF